MPDPKNKQAPDEKSQASQGEGSGDGLAELDQLRQELGTFKNKYENTQKELEDFRNRYDEREEQFQRDYGRQGQELGERVKQLQDLVGRVLQPAETAETGGKKKRPLAVHIPDNVMAQDEFMKFQEGLVEQIRDMQDELNDVRTAGGQTQSLQAEIKKLEDKINLIQYENYISKEENDLREKYGLEDRDLKSVKNYMKESGIYSMEAAAMKTPGLDKKRMYSNYLKWSGETNGHDGDDEPEEKPQRKSRYSAKQVGEEMLKTKPDDTIPRGGAKRTEDDLAWRTEMDAALKDLSFFRWPKQKQEEYEERLRQWSVSQEDVRQF